MTNVIKITQNGPLSKEESGKTKRLKRIGLHMIDCAPAIADPASGAGASLQELTQMIVQLRAELDEYRKSEGRFRYEGVEDVTARKYLQQERDELLATTSRMLFEVIERADRDPLTGLWNHSALHRKLRESGAESMRSGARIAMVLIDIDNFRFFNDAYGHMVGDEVLRHIVEALKSCCGPSDTLARYGGDEFAILLTGRTACELQQAVLNLGKTIEGIVYQAPGSPSSVPLNLSMGSAVFPDEGTSPIGALALADERLIRAKAGESESHAVCDELRDLLNESVEGFSMLDALITAVDNKDRYTRRHSEDVMLYCVKIAQNLGFNAEDLHTIKVSALLHDVGKIGVPDAILRKPAALTVTEFGAIKQHPMMGAVIVAAVPGFEKMLDGVRYHHERWDGKGYPCGLSGKETPRIARIMAVADAFSAMTTDRPYRLGMGIDHAREILRNGAGAQWDPECVEAFLMD